MTDTEIAWVAGIIEGEGTILNRDNTGIEVRVVMSDKDVIHRVHVVTGVGTMRGPYNWKSSVKELWTWRVSKRVDVTALLHSIEPWMGERRGTRIKDALVRLSGLNGKVEL